MAGFLPPSSSVTRVMVSRAARPMALPTAVEPVKLILDTRGWVVRAWPVTSPTYILLYKKQTNGDGAAVLAFFDWAFKNGDAAARQLDYIPLPASAEAAVRAGWAANITLNGKPVYTGK